MPEGVKPFSPIKQSRPSTTLPQAGTVPGNAVQLPPAGHQRREELSRRTDRLEEQAEAQTANLEAINPSALEIERELAGSFNALEVSNPDPNFIYKWVNFVSNNGLALREAINLPERWQVVTGDMVEAGELKALDGSRKLGDVMLVRMPRERYQILLKVRADRAARQARGHENNLRELGRKKGIKVYSDNDLPANVQERMTHPSPAAVAAMRGTQAAAKQFDQALRDGSIAV